ncbi:MAG: hypothetical protein HY096_09715 [Nitrospinae bacterium]|nr:hypothetical protein [Nitrospinota bacterium]
MNKLEQKGFIEKKKELLFSLSDSLRKVEEIITAMVSTQGWSEDKMRILQLQKEIESLVGIKERHDNLDAEIKTFEFNMR